MNEMKKCPFCAEEINVAAIKCKFCGTMLQENTSTSHGTAEKKETGKAWLWAIVGAVCGYALGSFCTGLFAGMFGGVVMPLDFIGAIVIGVISFRSSKRNNGHAPTWLVRSKAQRKD